MTFNLQTKVTIDGLSYVTMVYIVKLLYYQLYGVRRNEQLKDLKWLVLMYPNSHIMRHV